MKINTDKATTYLGTAAGLAQVLATSGIFGEHGSQYAGATAAVAIGLMGFFTNKKV